MPAPSGRPRRSRGRPPAAGRGRPASPEEPKGRHRAGPRAAASRPRRPGRRPAERGRPPAGPGPRRAVLRPTGSSTSASGRRTSWRPVASSTHPAKAPRRRCQSNPPHAAGSRATQLLTRRPQPDRRAPARDVPAWRQVHGRLRLRLTEPQLSPDRPSAPRRHTIVGQPASRAWLLRPVDQAPRAPIAGRPMGRPRRGLRGRTVGATPRPAGVTPRPCGLTPRPSRVTSRPPGKRLPRSGGRGQRGQMSRIAAASRDAGQRASRRTIPPAPQSVRGPCMPRRRPGRPRPASAPSPLLDRQARPRSPKARRNPGAPATPRRRPIDHPGAPTGRPWP